MHLFSSPGWLQACSAALLRGTLQALLKPVFSPRLSIPFQRRWLRGLAHSTLPARGVQREAAQLGGRPGEWLRTRGEAPAASTSSGALLYLHGGAYCVGSPATHRALTGRLALATGLPVFALDYRLAPEHPFPAGLDDALAAYRALRAQGPVVLAGDSAGGGLALACALALREAGDAPPAALYLISPWADMRTAAAPAQPMPGEAMLSKAWALDCAAKYLGQTAPEHPWCSPLLADLRGLPPTLIQAGTDEMLHGQALALEAALQAAGVAVRCEVDQARWHVFQLHGGVLASADAAIARAAAFIAPQLAAARAPVQATHEVAIMGAGMSGLCMAIQLKKAGMHDFVMLEKQTGLGGTWWDNRYPGAHVDVPAPAYSFSFAANPHWTRRFASAPEIHRYMQALALRHGLLPHLRLGTAVQEASFDAASGHWALRTDRGDLYRARHFVCSTGPLNQPRWPEIPGLADFQGQRLHSARWDATVPLQGRRVAVIGTGSTASQLVAPIAAQAGRLHVFQRTANWVLPRLDRRYFGIDRLLARLPPYSAAVRWAWVQVLEWGRRGFDEGTLARRTMLAAAAAHRQRQVADPALRAKLTPAYPLGCKRIIYSNDYYPALGRPNTELVTEAITRITATGIVTADGRERPVDVLVCATGFDTQQLLSSLQIRGQQGQLLGEVWRGNPEAYLGCTVAGFPNLYLMLGPNTATGHTSTLLYIEPQVQHVLACMSELRQRGLQWIGVRPEAQRAYNESLQARLRGSVWTQCHSWYQGADGRVAAIFPGFTAEYQRRVRRPDFSAYEFG
jgi:cation diffusion facilitator CzcD-associated flavoprotein CzcO/acetyl esterase/lipase